MLWSFGPEQVLVSQVVDRVLAICLGQRLTLSLCLSELLAVLQIISSRREVRVWAASWGRSSKESQNKYVHICSGFFLIPSPGPSSSPTSVFSFFPVPKVEENMCNTLQQCRPLFFGRFRNPPWRKKKLWIPKKKLGIFQEDVGDLVCLRTSNLEIALREVEDFQDDYATVRRLGN